MKCFVYRSTNKADTYLYLLDQDKMLQLPEGLKKLLGRTEYVLELDLDKTRQLANADIKQVKLGLDDQGFYVQLPKEHHISE